MDLGPDDAAGRQATAIATDNAAKDLLGGTQVGGDKEALETIIVTAQRKAIDNDCQQHGPHAVFYPGQNPGVVVSSGWQVPRDHGAESGYEVKIDENDHREWRFAHMDPATAIAQGAN